MAISTRSPNFKVILAALFLITVSSANAKQNRFATDSPRVIAVVLGQLIHYSEVHVSRETTAHSFEIQTLPVSNRSAAILGVKHQLELNRLSITIYQRSKAHLIQQYRIKVNSQNTSNPSNKKIAYFTKESSELRRKNTLLLQAVNLTNAGQGNVEVYNRLLSKEIPLDTWLANIRFYKTKRGMSFLLKLSRITPQEYEVAWNRAFIASKEDDKLGSEIDRQISIQDSKFKAALKILMAKNEQHDALKESEYVRLRRADWWSKFYRRAVLIKDDEFADVFRVLK